MSVAVTLVAANGIPVVPSTTLLGTPMTPVTSGGLPVVVVTENGQPCSFVTVTGTLLQADGVTPA